jgi:hypothetical protein
MPETLEGLKDASIAYSFTVEIGRKHGKNISYRKPLRVIRAPKPACADLVWYLLGGDQIASISLTGCKDTRRSLGAKDRIPGRDAQ